jgi:hypothetical protein
MIEIKLEEAASLTMDMELEGAINANAAELRFTIMSEGLQFSFPGTQISEGVYKVDFPPMQGKLNEGEYTAKVEIIVDGRYFQPLSETIKFTKEPKATVKMNETTAPKVQPATASVKIGKLEKPPVAPKVEIAKISDVKGIVTHLVENNSIDTTFALSCLNYLVLGENKELNESLAIVPSHRANEAEVLATLKLLQRNGTDVTGIGSIGALMNISERVSNEMRELFLAKGLPARDLQNLL